MSQNLNRYRADLRDLRFVLLEQFRLGDLLGKGPFADWGEEEVLSVLATAERYALEVAGPLCAVGDRQGCRLEQGQVRTPEGFKQAYQQLFENGLKSLAVDAEWGGANAPMSLAVLVTELTAGANPALDMYGGLTLGAAELLEAFGTAEQKSRYCENMFNGTWAGTMCLTEPQAGSDVGESTTSATKNEDGSYSIVGSKIFISGGDQDITDNIIHLVLARTPGAPRGTKGLSLFIVPKFREDGAPNDIQVAAVEHKMGLNGSATCALNFGESGRCRGELCGGVEGDGIRQMFKMMNFARIAVGVQGLGTASNAYLNALNYARDRKQGASIEQSRNPEAPRVPILEHADIRGMLLEMKAKVEGIRAMIVKAAHHEDCAASEADEAQRKAHRGQVELLTPLIKSYASDQAFGIAELAIQVCGGAGYIKDYPIEQCCRDAKVFSIYEGTNHIQALDLVLRKLQMDGGAHAMAFIGDVTRFADSLIESQRLGECGRRLAEAATAVTEASQTLAGFAASGALGRVPLVANRFLNMMAELCVGWLLLDAARVAEAALASAPEGTPDTAFYQGKLSAAEYYAHWVLPGVVAQGRVIATAPPSALKIPDDAFATV